MTARIELAVELPDVELLRWRAPPGVQILEVQGADTPCAARDAYLQSSARASAAKLRAAAPDSIVLWPGINPAVRTTRGDDAPARAAPTSTSA